MGEPHRRSRRYWKRSSSPRPWPRGRQRVPGPGLHGAPAGVVLVSAMGSALRGLVKQLGGISDADVPGPRDPHRGARSSTSSTTTSGPPPLRAPGSPPSEETEKRASGARRSSPPARSAVSLAFGRSLATQGPSGYPDAKGRPDATVRPPRMPRPDTDPSRWEYRARRAAGNKGGPCTQDPPPVVGVGIDPTTSRFSGARSTD